MNSKDWAEAVLALYGAACVCCGDSSVELDHVWPKSQGGIYHPGNGVPLCSPWSRMSRFTNGCHDAKTNSRLKYKREWLHPDTIDFLAGAGWIWWGEDGQTYGRGCRHFEPVTLAGTREGG